MRSLFLFPCLLSQIYYIFGFLFLVMIVLVVTCAEVSILLCYFQV